jgi:hypothetical protein
MKRTAYFALTIQKKHMLILLTEGETGYRVVDGPFKTWEVARDVAIAKNRMDLHLTFPQRDQIFASVLLARTEAGLVEVGRGWMCINRHYNAMFRKICEICGDAPFVRIPKGTRRKKTAPHTGK